ncbi:MAG: hypothetical protein A2Z88_02625 [Omnitrophica WOR_2 bacterium GWA2_47_8]|nr:MAG: hypothetical protein A2Z88_02625 [Omnitrophica WOR_2 bacterium GWA2_47_8]
MIGFLSFSKSEGTVAALLVTLLTGPYLLWSKKQDKSLLKKKFISYLLGFTATFLPTILFQVFYSPGNQTFINGFFSIENPSTIARLKMILAFLIVELQSGKWQGIWLLFFIGLILSKGKCFERSIRLIPLFLFGYLFIICFYYYLNTYFKIAWWLQVSLHRILFSLLPVMAFWVFYSLKDKKE